MSQHINYQDLDNQLTSIGIAEFHPEHDRLWVAYHEIANNYDSPEYRVYISKQDETVMVEIADYRFDPDEHIDEDRRPKIY